VANAVSALGARHRFTVAHRAAPFLFSVVAGSPVGLQESDQAPLRFSIALDIAFSGGDGPVPGEFLYIAQGSANFDDSPGGTGYEGPATGVR